MASFLPRHAGPSERALGLALVAALLGACASPPTSCEDHGGVRIRGVCVCPEDTKQDGDSCKPSSSPAGAVEGSGQVEDVDAASLPQAADGSLEGGHSAPHDGGRSSADAGAPATPSSPRADAGSPGNPTSRPASADASAPPEPQVGTPDGGGTQVTDAGANVPPPPAPTPAPGADGKCAPMGAWTFTRSFSGSCPADGSELVLTLTGQLEDPYVADDTCATLYTLTVGDCVLNYTQSCPVGSGMSVTRMGSLTMTSATTMSGSTTITSGQSSCASQVAVSATKN